MRAAKRKEIAAATAAFGPDAVGQACREAVEDLPDDPGHGVRTIVRHAHEHWDGEGYPEGLSGERIPLGARIVLAVDAYHAMTSDRPYRQAMSHADACKELEDNAGTQFDPEVVEAFLAVLSNEARGQA